MSMSNELQTVEFLLEDFDAICRKSFDVYRSYPPGVLIEHDSRAAAACRYAHMLSEADRRLSSRKQIIPRDINGLKVWIVGSDAVIRFKQMDEDGMTRNYPTRQARQYDRGSTLPGLPEPAMRLTVGYLLDATQTEYHRTQIAKPRGWKLLPEWCAAIITDEGGRKQWVDVTRQKGFGP